MSERSIPTFLTVFFFNTDRKSSYDLYQNRSIYPSGYIYFFFSLYECTNRTNFVLNLARTSVLPLRGVLMPIVLSTVVPVRVLYCVLKFCSYRCTTTTLGIRDAVLHIVFVSIDQSSKYVDSGIQKNVTIIRSFARMITTGRSS